MPARRRPPTIESRRSVSPGTRRQHSNIAFASTVRPFLETYCLGCHGKEKPKGRARPERLYDCRSGRQGPGALGTGSGAAQERHDAAGEGEAAAATPRARRASSPGSEAVRKHEGKRNAGDPGRVLARRLSNAEYDYTIRDLTGVDIRPTREFPVDPANEAGFDNSAESLAMSPALVKKYLEAARLVADHLVLKPRGLRLCAHSRSSPTPTATSTACGGSSIFTSGSGPTTPTISSPPGGSGTARHSASPAASLADFAAQAGLSPQVPGDDLVDS